MFLCMVLLEYIRKHTFWYLVKVENINLRHENEDGAFLLHITVLCM
jgi:hypothetical protein